MSHSIGKALTFIKEKVLTWESGMRKNVPKVLVVVTDGRSQDEVKKAALVIQQSGKQRHEADAWGLHPLILTVLNVQESLQKAKIADFTLLFLLYSVLHSL